MRGAWGALRGRRHFSPVEMVCPLLFGAALHIQVTIIMVRCVFCHMGDFLSNWVAWSLCLSMDYSLAYCALFCPAFSVSYYNLLSSCVVMVGQFFPTHHSLMFPGHHFILSSILRVFTLLIEDYSRKHVFIVLKKIFPICNNLRGIYLTGSSFKGL